MDEGLRKNSTQRADDELQRGLQRRSVVPPSHDIPMRKEAARTHQTTQRSMCQHRCCAPPPHRPVSNVVIPYSTFTEGKQLSSIRGLSGSERQEQPTTLLLTIASYSSKDEDVSKKFRNRPYLSKVTVLQSFRSNRLSPKKKDIVSPATWRIKCHSGCSKN